MSDSYIKGTTGLLSVPPELLAEALYIIHRAQADDPPPADVRGLREAQVVQLDHKTGSVVWGDDGAGDFGDMAWSDLPEDEEEEARGREKERAVDDAAEAALDQQRYGFFYWESAGGPDLCMNLLQWLLRQLPEQVRYITVELSYSSSQVQQEGFGGAAHFIQRREIRTMSTRAWLEEQMWEADNDL